eukprot:TRINITY_DN113897_c0_g1_i1.p1 TRINITY_DN113897_c0_g1~~TRINITY_DN113897_c0_g1_i1.p1  ORF type:complete len:438 (+),score=71.54 TRINITY_DN113897_c0_g1_i1:53-1315(+)
MAATSANFPGRMGRRRVCGKSLYRFCVLICVAVAFVRACNHIIADGICFVLGAARFQVHGRDARDQSDLARRAEKANWRSWQRRLDKALLDVDAIPQARIKNLRKVLQNPFEVLRDVSTAVSAVTEKGFKEGHPEAIDALWPEGTTAREDLEGLAALRKQVPELLEDFRGVQSPQGQSTSRGANQPPSPADVLSSLSALVTDDEKRTEALDEVKNIFRRTPKGLEQPSYTVVQKLAGGVELREYKPFTAAQRAMTNSSDPRRAYSSAEGFTSLAGYLFGANSEKKAMAMTMPVEINFGKDVDANMSFVMPSDVGDASNAPVPDEDGVRLTEVPARLVAVLPFRGVATAGEVERQREALNAALEGLEAVDREQYSVLQYNPPYTLPWRRRNELAVVVQRSKTEDAVSSNASDVSPQLAASS